MRCGGGTLASPWPGGASGGPPKKPTPLRRFTALYIALVAFRLLLEHANEQARCQAKDSRQDDMPRIDNVDARDIIRHLQTVLNGACQQRDAAASTR